MTLLERIVGYATVGETNPKGLRLERIEVGTEVMERLAKELEELTAVDVGGRPESITYRNVRIVNHAGMGSSRIDAVWEHHCLTLAGGPLA